MERFFFTSFKIDEVKTLEFLLRTYSNVDYILALEYKNGIEFISEGYKKSTEEKVWHRWLADYLICSVIGTEVKSFEEYINKAFGSNSNNEESTLTKQEIEEQVKDIINLTL